MKQQLEKRPVSSVDHAPRRDVDVLMITYNRPAYTEQSLRTLLSSADAETRVWVWHNGEDTKTLSVVESFRSHPRFHKFHHSPENKKLREPTNWLFQNAQGAYLSKVDDDCLVPDGWIEKLRNAHEQVPGFGILGCWRFYDADFLPEIAKQKIFTFPGGSQILRNFWVEGSGYLMKAAVRDQLGPIGPKQSFTGYCIESSLRGWVNGWIYPFLHQDHMDDPRSPYTTLRTDADLLEFIPLTAKNNGIRTIQDWTALIQLHAREVQTAPINPRYWSRWRRRLRSLKKRLDAVVRKKGSIGGA